MIRRFFNLFRRKPTTHHKLLALHIFHAQHTGALK